MGGRDWREGRRRRRRVRPDGRAPRRGIGLEGLAEERPHRPHRSGCPEQEGSERRHDPDPVVAGPGRDLDPGGGPRDDRPRRPVQGDDQSRQGRGHPCDEAEQDHRASPLPALVHGRGDEDRGGDLILKELLQVAEVDFIARAPRGKEVEELTQKQIMKCLRNKIPADQYVEMYGLSGQVYKAESEFPEPKPAAGPQTRPEPRPEFRPEPREPRESREDRPPAPLTPTTKVLNPKLEKYRDMLLQLGGSSTARLLDEGDGVVTEVPVRQLVDTLKTAKQTRAIVFDGIITQRILDIASEMNMHSVVGTKMGTITKQPAGLEVWTRSDLAP